MADKPKDVSLEDTLRRCVAIIDNDLELIEAKYKGKRLTYEDGAIVTRYANALARMIEPLDAIEDSVKRALAQVDPVKLEKLVKSVQMPLKSKRELAPKKEESE